MAKTTDNYSAFEGINLSNARSENESYEDYKWVLDGMKMF